MNKFFKYVGSSVVTVFLGLVCNGKAVDQATAKQLGSKFLMQKHVSGVNSAADLSISYVANATVNGETVSAYYVFNVANAAGFVMISADDNINPILAWSNESSFDFSKINPDAKFWVNNYQKQIEAALTNNTPAQAGVAENWNALLTSHGNLAAKTTAVAPLIHTTWDQAPGYNNDCPGSGSNKAVTGCVATCMAEIMQFWNWPTVGCGYHTYTPSYTPGPGYGYPAQTADFGNTAYNWTSMDGSLTGSNSAIALLMYHAGVAVDMQYGPETSPSGSGAYVNAASTPLYNGTVHTINCAEYAMKTYFHYKRTLQGVARTDDAGTPVISDPTWIAMIETELNAGRPVMYAGQGADGGHCWVCDGWESGANTFHFNFGWSGASNGYYSINNVAPPALGTGGGGSGNNFNDFQAVVIGIQPDSFPSATGNIEMGSHLDCTTNSPMQYLTAFSVTAKVTNSGSSSFSGDFSAQVFDTSGNLVGVVQTITGQSIAAGATSSTLTFNSPGMVGMIPEMSYNIRLMYRTGSSAPWSAVANNDTLVNYNAIDVRNTQIFSNNQEMEVYATLAVTPGTSIPAGSTLTLNTKVFNSGTSSFNGTLKAVLTNVATGTQYPVQQLTGQVISAGLDNAYTFTNTGLAGVPSGVYALAVMHQYGGTGNSYVTGSDFYENPVIVKIGASTGVSTTPSAADEISLYPNPANGVVNISLGGATTSDIWITDIRGRQLQQVSVAGNQTVVTVPVAGYAAGMYFANMQVNGETVTKKFIVK